ncbi:MAG: type II toxin-antitoxin system VapC family toxin [Verrucomicrobia bacterium]|nr:type II toxin-antitoxin system VapC family toxin [Verrucomicrobiota bacterium]
MRLLLDTHTLLWFLEGNSQLSAAARSAIEDQANDKWISHATAWEVAIKLRLGRLTLQLPYEELFPGVIPANGFQVLAPDFQHYRILIQLPEHHRDPFDRLLIAQAKAEGCALVTRDPQFTAYGVPIFGDKADPAGERFLFMSGHDPRVTLRQIQDATNRD